MPGMPNCCPQFSLTPSGVRDSLRRLAPSRTSLIIVGLKIWVSEMTDVDLIARLKYVTAIDQFPVQCDVIAVGAVLYMRKTAEDTVLFAEGMVDLDVIPASGKSDTWIRRRSSGAGPVLSTKPEPPRLFGAFHGSLLRKLTSDRVEAALRDDIVREGIARPGAVRRSGWSSGS